MKGFLVLPNVSSQEPHYLLYGFNVRREFSQLVTDHVFRNRHVNVRLAVVNLELEADKVGQDRGGTGLRPDGHNLLSGSGAHDGETICVKVRFEGGSIEGCSRRGGSPYGTM